MASEPQAVSAEERMIGLISKHQTVLHGYIFALIQDISRTDDILQETNLILWRKAAEYDASKPFLPWARSIAWYQVKAATRNLSRDRLVFSETTTVCIVVALVTIILLSMDSGVSAFSPEVRKRFG